ncbi:hypothetical protein B0H66DRAFT_35865 [Apodospora peruviana]|uniref:Uncharacterized protein n=1 Tax=Apodospora peruviana TaxID=516989 RepID=A0AAE0IRI5_9PEZI|nr:hypothetical protein B0H66DRAFT_35865 [Apodospora peruviana]
MDILFSPPNIGALPSSAMAEVELRTQSLRETSLQRMLQLEKKYKMERLQSAPTSPPSSPPPPADFQDHPPLQIRRADSLSQQQNRLMLKAARRSATLPPLSISIPDPVRAKKGDLAREEVQEEDRGEETETETIAEPLHKQVKFLAPDEEDEDMSDQSSICQSPSWEGYGQRKKEKKKEAERRKREKEQAEKEAKAAKKRLAARLSKSPPPPMVGRNKIIAGLTNAERSMSDPLLTGPHMSVESRLTHPPNEVERAVSTNDLRHIRPQQYTETETLSELTPSPRSFVGGVKLEREREAMTQSNLQPQYPPSVPYQSISDSGPEPRRQLQKSLPVGPAASGQSSASLLSGRQDSRSPRENTFPPSASRTPMLRHMPAPGHSRSNSLLQGATKILKGQDVKSSGDSEMSSTSDRSQNSPQIPQGTDRGRDRGGYVRHQRALSAGRGVDPVSDEPIVGNSSQHSSSTRSSSRNTQHTRRSSITQEAKSMAMKITGKKSTPASKDEKPGKEGNTIDYFNFMDRSLSTSVLSAMASGGSSALSSDGGLPTRPKTKDSSHHSRASQRVHSQRQELPLAQERPATSLGTASSKEPSITDSIPSTQSKKGRSLKDAARAAFHISKTPTPSANTSKPLAAMPPYLALRARKQSQAPAAAKKTPTAPPEATPASGTVPLPNTTKALPEYNPETRQSGSGQPSSSNSVKTSDVETQPGSRVSEGSSTSSAYEDGSPLPSPATTPDTSRPQSSKDMPLTVGEVAKGTIESLVVQDDERTLRQSIEGSRGSNTSTTPRLGSSEERESAEMNNEDRWSRTALPLEIDCDAQSFTTSVSNQDDQDNTDNSITPMPRLVLDTQDTMSGERETARNLAEIRKTLSMAMPQTRLARSFSDPALRAGDPDNITRGMFLPPIEQTISIPPRSRRRNQRGERSKEGSRERATKREAEDRLSSDAAETFLADVSRKKQSEPAEAAEKKEAKRERKQRQQQNPVTLRAHEEREIDSARDETDCQEAGPSRSSTTTPTPTNSLGRSSTSSSIASPNSKRTSSRPMSPTSPRFPSNAHFDDIFESPQALSLAPADQIYFSDASAPRSAPSPVPIPPPASHAAPKPPGPPRTASAPTPSSGASMASTSTSLVPLGPSASRPAGPVSILKQPTRSTSDPSQATPLAGGARPHVASSLPKHMQQQAGISVRPPATGGAENRMSPVGKMFVECCNCKFYHDLPSKLYECMAKPDAVVEDRLRGISGAITTMVKCPWCLHNMSTSCCAGYMAVVYLKEKLH